MSGKIPVSVIITTRNEADNLPRCLSVLSAFDEIVIVDSKSNDGTEAIATKYGARYVPYEWNGQYPKKRQWCLENLSLKNEHIFFVDADEVLTPAIIQEITRLDWRHAGYFVRGQYVWRGRPLRHGLMNNKLALFDRQRVFFPVVDDLDVPGMGEIEGHYQPVLHDKDDRVGQIAAPLLHYAGDEGTEWTARHERYAAWEAQMIKRDAYPAEVSPYRALLKKIFRRVPGRPLIAFLHSYILKGGFLDGCRGFEFARSRMRYYTMVRQAFKNA